MNLPTWYDTGTASVATGSAIVSGFSNFWGADAIMVGDLFCDPAQPLIPPQRVKSAKAGELELWAPWPGAPLVKAPYEVRYVGIIERSTAQSRRVLEELGQVDAWYDLIVEDDAARLALETANSPLRANYRVLVKNPGVIWAKKSGAFGDWIGPVEFRGPIGERGPVGPIGVNSRGAYAAPTVYGINDGVTYNGSSFRKLTTAAAGNAPSSASPPVNNANWEVLSAAGKDGAGTGDVKGPPGVTDGAFAGFNGETGKLLQELNGTTATALLNTFAVTLKGLVPAPTVSDASGGKVLGAGGWRELPITIGLMKIRLFASSGTYTRDPKLVFAVGECQGAGGGGGGVTGSASYALSGSGGGSGAYAKRIMTPADIGASQPITVGVGGGSGTNAASGGTGGTSSIGALCSATGGVGATPTTSASVGTPGAGGSTGVGDVVIPGVDGSRGGYSATPSTLPPGGTGAPSFFAGGGRGGWAGGGSVQGGSAGGIGAGGGGGFAGFAALNSIGAPGGNGIVIITEHCSE